MSHCFFLVSSSLLRVSCANTIYCIQRNERSGRVTTLTNMLTMSASLRQWNRNSDKLSPSANAYSLWWNDEMRRMHTHEIYTLEHASVVWMQRHAFIVVTLAYKHTNKHAHRKTHNIWCAWKHTTHMRTHARKKISRTLRGEMPLCRRIKRCARTERRNWTDWNNRKPREAARSRFGERDSILGRGELCYIKTMPVFDCG